MKPRWQIEKLKGYCENVIIFIDEPYLVSIGSSYVNIDLEKTMASIDAISGAIRKEGALAGLHCCGNTDWHIILERGIDILSFDAYTFMKEFFLYKEDIKKFLDRGGTIAWGAIPTSVPSGRVADEREILDILKTGTDYLSKAFKGASSHIITPSCGLGTLDEESARVILDLTVKVSNLLKGNAIDG